MTGSTANAPPIASKVEFLCHAGAYPEGTRRVQVVETHMSWLFLTDAWAYKLKKPVRYAFLDFSTLEARHRDALEEIRLNRRLAREVYQGTVPLTVSNGHMRLGGGGRIIDWLVKMRRLPARRMLDNLIREHAVDMSLVRRLAELLVGFYRDAPKAPLTGPAYRERMVQNVRANRDELLRPAYRLDAALVRQVSDAQRALLEDRPPLFEARAQQGRLVEGHGDLRPEHIFLDTHPVVIDCLAFNRAFRELDPVDELSFLAMECDWMAAGPVGAEVLDVYFRDSGDPRDDRLIAFYKCYRACLRTKIALWHTRDGAVHDHGQWLNRAGEYLALAQTYVRAL